jgi:hypothetical protein
VHYSLPAPQGQEPVVHELILSDWAKFHTDASVYQQVMTLLQTGTLLPNDLVPEHCHITMCGADWNDENQQPRESLGVSGPGAWQCRNKHTPGDFFMASNRDSCKCCGDKRDTKAVRDNGQIVRAPWDLPWDEKHQQKEQGYVMFKRETGFVNTLDRAKGNRHFKTRFPRIRVVVLALFPGITEELARQYFVRCIEWKKGDKEREAKIQACLDIITRRAESDGSGT